ncbi:hypothetical protein HII31_13648 [Pseudocercospora fuligena]|uniref:Uncharacterized protein n=1 Tax=Pseudocercospora fuligena TaxID=685502 RepID=A0A8H6R4D3_9PEZI|nr:hypothetical protein HII31_13648 [Pseudocercospora fuligena]
MTGDGSSAVARLRAYIYGTTTWMYVFMSGQRDQREPQSSGSLSEAERYQSAHDSLNQDHLLRSRVQEKEQAELVQEAQNTGEEEKSTQASSNRPTCRAHHLSTLLPPERVVYRLHQHRR